MNLDFPTILVLLTLITGLVWAWDHWVGAPARRRKAELPETSADSVREPLLVDWSRSFFPILLLVLLLRSFIVEPFRIPSNSMMPTLLTGDFILVNKFVYGLRLPVVHTKILGLGGPERGDVAVFRYPRDPHVDFIKRIVALPGDRIGYRGKTLFVNDHPMPLEKLRTYTGFGSGADTTGFDHVKENLMGREHEILINTRVPDFPMGCRLARDREYIVPEGHYFVMGDNRDQSNDSRCWGPVPEENLVGKAFMIWMSWDWNGSGSPSWGRIGQFID